MPLYESAAHLHLGYTYVACLFLIPQFRKGIENLSLEKVANVINGMEQLLYKD